MLSKLFWFALGAGFMRYTLSRQSGARGAAGGSEGRLSGHSPDRAGWDASAGRGLQQSLRGGAGDATGARAAERPGGAVGTWRATGAAGGVSAGGAAMLPDDGHLTSLMLGSSGTGQQGGSTEQADEDPGRATPASAMGGTLHGA